MFAQLLSTLCLVFFAPVSGAEPQEAEDSSIACGTCLLACYESATIGTDAYDSCVEECGCANAESTPDELAGDEVAAGGEAGDASADCADCLYGCYATFFDDNAAFGVCSSQCDCDQAPAAAIPAAEDAQEQEEQQQQEEEEVFESDDRHDILILSDEDCERVAAEMADNALPADLVYQGCYASAPFPHRRLAALAVESQAYMTVEFCAYMCYYAGFSFMGVEDGDTCFCDDATHDVAVRVREEEGVASQLTMCDQPCSGDESELCGGISRTAVWAMLPQEMAAEEAMLVPAESMAVTAILRGRQLQHPVPSLPIERALLLFLAAMGAATCGVVVHVLRRRRKAKEEHARAVSRLREAGYQPLGSIRTQRF